MRSPLRCELPFDRLRTALNQRSLSLACFSHLLVLNCSKPRLGASLIVQYWSKPPGGAARRLRCDRLAMARLGVQPDVAQPLGRYRDLTLLAGRAGHSPILGVMVELWEQSNGNKILRLWEVAFSVEQATLQGGVVSPEILLMLFIFGLFGSHIEKGRGKKKKSSVLLLCTVLIFGGGAGLRPGWGQAANARERGYRGSPGG